MGRPGSLPLAVHLCRWAWSGGEKTEEGRDGSPVTPPPKKQLWQFLGIYLSAASAQAETRQEEESGEWSCFPRTEEKRMIPAEREIMRISAPAQKRRGA